MPIVTRKSPNFFLKPLISSKHLSISCPSLAISSFLKMPNVYVLFKFFWRLKQPLKIPFLLLAFKFSIQALFLPLWQATLRFSFIFFAEVLDGIAVSYLIQREYIDMYCVITFEPGMVSFSLRQCICLISHAFLKGVPPRNWKCLWSSPPNHTSHPSLSGIQDFTRKSG